MNPDLTPSVFGAEQLHSLLYTAGFIQGKWLVKFLIAFLPVFLGSGLLLGMIYVLVMRAIRVDRTNVEAWFEAQRHRLQSGPIPIIEKAQPVMVGALYAIYGRTALRRFGTSFVVGLLFTSTIFGLVYWRYKHVSATVREIKAQLEQNADSVLYNYVTNPQLKPEYEKPQQQRAMMVGDQVIIEDVYTGGIYDELRNRESNFQPRLVASVFAHPARIELTLLFLLEGSYIHPGFQWLDSLFVFIFNVALDFVSVTIAIAFLRLLGDSPSFPMAIITFVLTLCSTLACAGVSFLSYSFFFRGNTGFFWQVLIVLPLSLAATLAAAGVVITFIVSVFKKEEPEERVNPIWGILAAFGGYQGLRYVWSYWHATSVGFIHLRDILSFPYMLAGTTLVPATLTLAAFGLMLLAKLTAEPARVLPEVYMTFVKEEVGGTQAAGIILLVGLILGVVAGFVWPAT